MRSLLAAVLVAAAVSAGCGGGDESAARDAVAETSANLGSIRSGEIDTRLRLEAEGAEQPSAVGFELRGPFSLPEEGGLPTARVTYTELAGDRSADTTIVAAGDDAFVEVDEQAYELPRGQRDQLQLGPDVGSATGGELRVERWLREPRLGEGPSVDGQPTDEITGELDVPRAVNDLLGLADRAGAEAAGLEPLRGARAEELRDAVRSSEVELLTGRDDRLLRRLSVDVELDAPKLEGGGGSLPELSSVRFDFTLELARPNSSVRVEAPRNARPLSQLRGAG